MSTGQLPTWQLRGRPRRTCRLLRPLPLDAEVFRALPMILSHKCDSRRTLKSWRSVISRSPFRAGTESIF